MNRIVPFINSTKKRTWCYRNGYYQIPDKISVKKIFSYGQWLKETKKPIIRRERQQKIREYFDQYN
tara:strand:- start:7312 stop:7509 length:198 start_codon:yes stop_codon:yes gene_type:complete